MGYKKIEITRGEKSIGEILSAIASNEVLQMWRLDLDFSFHLDTQHRYHMHLKVNIRVQPMGREIHARQFINLYWSEYLEAESVRAHLEFSPNMALNCLEEQGLLKKKAIKA